MTDQSWRQRLRELADRLGSQRELAKLVGVDPRSINRWVNGPNVPSLDDASDLARAAGVSLDWLAYGADPPALDEDLLIEIIVIAEREVLRVGRPEPQKYAELIALVYQQLQPAGARGERRPVDPAAVRRAFRLVS